MEIATEKDITGEAAYVLRKRLKLTQAAFWASVGMTQASGCRYEADRSRKIPRPTRILMFVRYVAELEIDATTPEGVARLFNLAQLQRDRTSENCPESAASNQPV